MSKDFTLQKYEHLLKTALEKGYHLTSYEDYINNPKPKTLILRHDVDKRPINSLLTAQLQYRLGVEGTYYFRAVPESFDVSIIKAITNLNHEIGYHYEDLTICKGDYEKAIEHFEKWLNKLKTFYQVKTICMHGSPLSKWDNRQLWEKYNYKDFGVIAEPYFDLDFNEIFYFTDTGRRWNGNKISVRDKVTSEFNMSYRTTDEIITAFNNNELPDLMMQNIHPQRWTDSSAQWMKEWVSQNIKNVIKKIIFVKK